MERGMRSRGEPATLAVQEVSRKVNNPRNDGPELLEAVNGDRS
jgi:putative SOS response-associated peptidase YedK